MKYGFCAEPHKPEDWFLGSKKATKRFGPGELMPDGHGWEDHLPRKEMQRDNGVETMACTVYAPLNCLETLADYHGFDDFPSNCSERFNAILAGVSRNGNPPYTSAESIRRSGVIPSERLPFDDSIDAFEKFYSPKPMRSEFLTEGLSILKKYVIGNEWVFNPFGLNFGKDKKELLKIALGRGTVAVSVYAWRERDGLYFKERQWTDNHIVQLVDYREGRYWKVYDTYEKTLKKLEWEYPFENAILFFLDKRLPASAIQQMIKNLYAEIARLTRMLLP